MNGQLTISPEIFFHKKTRILWHLLLWLLVIIFYTLFFGHQSGNYNYTFLFVMMLLPITIGTSYFFIYYLIPKYFDKKRYGKFLLYSIYTLLASVYLEVMAAFSMVFLFIFGDGAPLDATTIDIYFLIVAMFFVVLFVISIKLLKTWYQKQQVLKEVTQQKLEAELKMLRTQIQPHFLFNSLNSIYSLALSKSEKTPEMVLKLSEILDYLLYECDVDEVFVEREAHILQNYLDLQQMRFGSRVTVEFISDIKDKSAKIAPMILLPFVENSFKHGVSASRDPVEIDIKLQTVQSQFLFEISNDVPRNRDGKKETNHGGVGLPNISRRLEVVYAGRHNLEIKNEDHRFSVSLHLELSKNQHA